MKRRALLIGLALVLSGGASAPAQPKCAPTHIHFKAFAAGYRPLTTQLYLKGGQSVVAFDLVLVKE